MRHVLLVLAVGATTASCLTAQLRTPVEDHYVQSQTIADKNRAGEYEANPGQLQEDLDAMAKQAKLLTDIINNRKPSEDPAPHPR